MGGCGRRSRFAGLVAGLRATLAVALAGAPAAAQAAYLRTYLLVGPDGARIARAVTSAVHCPSLVADGRARPMRLRAAPQTAPQRPTQSAPADSKPSVFAGRVCEAVAPARARRLTIAGRRLPVPPAVIRRIVVIGDTGCRLKKSDGAYQACNDPAAYPFASIAAAAARWRPDLVVHVGDYLYRENACPAGDAGCAGTPWGYGSDAWRADFLDPAAPLMAAAPLALARGNHETCDRGGQGWQRYLDVHPLTPQRSCDDPADDDVGNFGAPFAVPLGDGAQLVVYDSSATTAAPLAAGGVRAAHYRDDYAAIAALARRARHTILVNHQPVLGFAARRDKSGAVTLLPGNGGLQSVFGAFTPRFSPANVDILLSGHIHLWEEVSFSSDHPAQFIAGFSGTEEEPTPLPATRPAGASPAPGAVVANLSSWRGGFGFMTMERTGPDRWRVQVRDVDGAVVNTCRVVASKAWCAKDQIPAG